MRKEETFFTNLFADCLEGGRFIEARQINRHDDKRNQIFCSSIEDFLKRTENQPAKFDSYFGVNPREGKNGTSQAIKQVTCLWGDVDWKNFKGGRQQAIKEIQEFPLKPTVVIESGHGFQPYWFLKEPEPVENQDDFRLVIKGLHKRINSDPIDDLPRILRIPGTLNYKDLKEVVPCKIIFADYSRRYVISDFETFALAPGYCPEWPQKMP